MRNQLQYPEYPPQGGHPQQGGYPPQGGYPEPGGYPPQGVHPQPEGYLPQGVHPQPGGYPPQGGHPQQGGYPPQGGYPQQGGYPPQGGYPQQGGYPPQGGYPQQGGYPPPGYQQGTVYPPQQDGGALPYGFSQADDSAILGEPKDDDVNGFGSSFSTKAIRHAFIRKVYLILTLQLSATMAVIALFTLHDGVKSFVRSHAYLYYMSYAVFLVTYLTLMCCDGVRRKFPLNLVLLVVFTAAFTYMAAMISSFYSTHIVLLAVGLTAGITLLLTLFAVQTKYDFTGCGMFLCVASLVVLLFGFVAMFISIYTNIKIVQLVYAGLIALLFSMYLVYDTQQIVGGRKHEISAEEHIYGAIVLYMDIMQIFLALLQLVGASNK